MSTTSSEATPFTAADVPQGLIDLVSQHVPDEGMPPAAGHAPD